MVPGNQIPTLSGFQNLDNDQVESALDAKLLIYANGNQAQNLASQLRDAGFKAVSYTNEHSVALQIIQDDTADLVVLDFADQGQGHEHLLALLEDSSIRTWSAIALLDRHDEFGKQIASQFQIDELLLKPIDNTEFLKRVDTVLENRFLARKLEKYTEQLQTDILLDPLTQIANRRAFDFELSRKMIEWQRQRNPMALMMIDIDFFKKVNDIHGHQAGDYVLKHVAELIAGNIREMDLVCRFGGEEFAAIVPIKRRQQSFQTAERMREAIESSMFTFDGKEIEVTVSIGVAEAMKGDDRELIISRADAALYHSKRSGRNQVSFHDGSTCEVIDQGRETNLSDKESGREESFSVWTTNENAFNLLSTNILIASQNLEAGQKIRKVLDQSGFRNLIVEVDSDNYSAYFQIDPPELVILDSGESADWGMATLKSIHEVNVGPTIPSIVLVSDEDRKTKDEILELGGVDLIQKPYTGNELNVRVRNTLLASAHARYLENYTAKLEHDIKNRTSELIASRREAIQCLARAAEIRDDISGRHILRVGKYAAQIAQELGFTDSQVIEMEHAAQLHDVGKIGLPDSILKKASKLTDEEFDLVKDHCNAGGMIIRDSGSEHSCEQTNLFLLESCSSSVMKMAALVAESHHEKWDGTGYPHGLRGQNIPIEGRIVAVCDVFDAISHPKPYRIAYHLEDCFKMIRDGSGTHFDPEIVEAFFCRKEQILQIYQDFGSFDES